MDDLYLFLITGLIILFSSFMRGTTGFGMAVTSIPFLLLLLPLKEVVVLIAFMNVVFSVVHLIREKGSIKLVEVVLMTSASLLGVTLGVFALKVSDEEPLKIICGVLIVVYALIVLIGFNFKIRKKVKSFILAGFIGGLLAGSIAIGGLPAAIILSSSGFSKRSFRYTMSVFFLVTYLFSSTAYGLSGMINKNVIYLALFSIPFMLAGLYIGNRFVKHIPEKMFKRLVLILSIVMGSIIVLETLFSLS